MEKIELPFILALQSYLVILEPYSSPLSCGTSVLPFGFQSKKKTERSNKACYSSQTEAEYMSDINTSKFAIDIPVIFSSETADTLDIFM